MNEQEKIDKLGRHNFKKFTGFGSWTVNKWFEEINKLSQEKREIAFELMIDGVIPR